MADAGDMKGKAPQWEQGQWPSVASEAGAERPGQPHRGSTQLLKPTQGYGGSAVLWPAVRPHQGGCRDLPRLGRAPPGCPLPFPVSFPM